VIPHTNPAAEYQFLVMLTENRGAGQRRCGRQLVGVE
jgi:hypothetical protein